MYMCIYIYRERERHTHIIYTYIIYTIHGRGTANLHTNMVDFGGLDSSVILILRGGIPRPMGNFPEVCVTQC